MMKKKKRRKERRKKKRKKKTREGVPLTSALDLTWPHQEVLEEALVLVRDSGAAPEEMDPLMGEVRAAWVRAAVSGATGPRALRLLSARCEFIQCIVGRRWG